MPFSIKELPYSYDALEPHIDAETMKIHHTKHHEAYCRNLNEAVKGTPLENLSIEAILQKDASALPEAVRNNGGGVYNHQIFWKMMAPAASGQPSAALLKVLNETFKDLDHFKKDFSDCAEKHFGSGWVWLVLDGEKLKIEETSNQDSPLMRHSKCLLGLDVWEHAYYLKYRNKRPDYISAWWNVVNWKQVQKNFEVAMDSRDTQKEARKN